MTPFQASFAAHYAKERSVYEEKIRMMRSGQIVTGEIDARLGGYDSTYDTILDLERQLSELTAMFTRIMAGAEA